MKIPISDTVCPKMLIKCPIMLIKCPEIMIICPTTSQRLIGSFHSLSFKKSVRPHLTRPQLLKAGSSMVKKEELTINRQFSSKQKGVVSLGLLMSEM